MKLTFPASLRHPVFRRVWLGQAISSVGDSIYLVALPLWVLDITGSGFAVALVLGALVLPSFATPITGSYSDRHNKRTILIWADIGRLIILIPLLASPINHSLSAIVILSIMGISLHTFGYTAFNAMLPDLLDSGTLVNANAVRQSAQAVAGLITPLVAIAVLHGASFEIIVLVNGITYLVAAAFTASVSFSENRRESELPPFLTGLTSGLRELTSHPILRNLAILRVVFIAQFGSMQLLFLLVADSLNYAQDWTFGASIAARNAGLALAGLALAVLIQRAPIVRLLRNGSMVMVGAALLLALGSWGSLPVSNVGAITLVVVGATALGGAISVLAIVDLAAVQKWAPPQNVGLISGAFTSIDTVAALFSLALVPFLAEVVGVQYLLVIFAGTTIAGVLYIHTQLMKHDSPAETAEMID